MKSGAAAEAEVRSLFLVSLPRSLSSLIYHVLRAAAGLREPAWTSDGEILNLDRFVLYPGPSDDTSRKFIVEGTSPRLFQAVTEFLGSVVAPSGYAYKDVVQPFIASGWLGRSSVPTHAVRIKRNVADVAYSMLRREWYYPGRLFPEMEDEIFAVVRGLVRAEQALDRIPGEHIDFERMIVDERPLGDVLRKLYPERRVARVKYIDDGFDEMRRHVLRRRTYKEYKMLQDYVAQALALDSIAASTPLPAAPAPFRGVKERRRKPAGR
jgi:hypothetical protein